ncbi:MAG: LamG-like jellyroll fold domain-containing protein, partial [Planctomycetota bacterium]
MFRSERSWIVSVLVLGFLVAGVGFGSVLDRRVADDNDDAEQLAGGGAMDLGSTDLELPYEEPNQTDLQVTGVRFTDIGIPQGAPIISAYLQFQVDETKAGDEPVSLIIDGELSENAEDFAAADIEPRGRTTASVVWSVPNWLANNEQGPDQRSPDLAAIIQEIIDQPGWTAGNSIALILSDNPANPSQGVRCAVSHDDNADGPTGAPLLHIEYLNEMPSNPLPADGEIIDSNPVVLAWLPGDYRQASHIYFGDNRADVEAGTGGTDLGMTYRAGYPLGDLEPGKTYYWRIVEVNDVNPAGPWEGPIWTFKLLPLKAANPDPPNGSANIRNDVTLSWDAGFDMANQDVYLGTSYASVLISTTPTVNTANTSWQPTGLIESGRTYYWRVDTNDTSGQLHKGDVWSFSTLPAIAISDPNLIGWWTFEDELGSFALDQSGHDNLGVFVGDPQRVAGVAGNALDLDGDDFMRIDEVADDIDSNNITLSAWVNTTIDDCDWYSCNNATGGGNVLIFALVDGEPAVLDVNAYEGLPTTPVNDGQWHMLTYVRDGTTGYIYVDAVLQNTHEARFSFSDDNRWSLGQEWDAGGPSELLTGLIDDVRLYNKALTAAEITEIMRVDRNLAWNPGPRSGAIVRLDELTRLEWSPGDMVNMHDVYLGTDRATVVSADTTTAGVYKGRHGVEYFDPGELEPGRTFYWRIDEFNTDSSLTRGMIWSFTTMPAIAVTDPNLIGWWTFEGQSGSYEFDRSGHDNFGVFVGEPLRVEGYDGMGLYLDGDDFMRIDEVADDIGGGNVTLSAWVNTTIEDSDWYSCNTADGSSNVLIFGIVDGEPAVLDANNAYEGLPTATVNEGEWHMLTYVCDGTTGYIYIDAALHSVHQAQINFSPDDRWSIGQEWDSANPTEFLTGMVDDVRLYNKALTQPEIAQVMRIDLNRAWNPSPRQGGTVEYDEMGPLQWSPGDNAQSHDIYFGTDRDAVASADTTTAGVYKGRRTTTSFDVGPVLLGKTYYWRIDEARSGQSPIKGVIWRFSIGEYLVVDDFESYVPWNAIGDHIFDIWRDGFGDCSVGSGNDTGATVTENPDPPGPAFDAQSMRYDFDNDGTVQNPCTMVQQPVSNLYSRIEAQTAALLSGIGSDWVKDGARALRLSFYGTIGTATTESLWVQLQDTGGYGNKVFYGSFTGEDPQDFNEASWHNWNIDLADFGVDLENVVSIVIGIGEEGSTEPGGAGTIYIDNVRLYVPRFIPARLTQRPTDVVFDGVIDYLDMLVLMEDWLLTDYSAPPLVAWYKLDGNADDSGPNGFHGTLENEPNFVLGVDSVGQAIDCNESEWVDTDVNAVDMGIAGHSARTITS